MSTQQDGLAKTLIALSGNESVITVRKPFVQFTGSLEAGMMLSQLLYWTPRARIPGGWIAKSDREFNDELCLSSYAIRKARKELERLGILETALKKFAGAPTTHYRLKMAELRQAWATFISQMDLSNSQNPIVEIKESSTETTTETTTNTPPAAGDESPPPAPPPPKKKPKAKKERKPVPVAVKVFQANAHRYPAKAWYADVDQTVGTEEADLAFWGEVVKSWVGYGWNPTNVKGMLECYKERRLPVLGGNSNGNAALNQTVAAAQRLLAKERMNGNA
jgi:hypothetical protein